MSELDPPHPLVKAIKDMLEEAKQGRDAMEQERDAAVQRAETAEKELLTLKAAASTEFNPFNRHPSSTAGLEEDFRLAVEQVFAHVAKLYETHTDSVVRVEDRARSAFCCLPTRSHRP